MNPISVERLSAKNLAAARRVASEVMGEADVPEDRLLELLADERCIVLAANSDDGPVGYLVAYCFPSLAGERLAYLYDIEVRPEHRRSGVGRQLVHELLCIARQLGIASIWVGSSLTNLAACELWRATGAQRDGDQYVEFTFDLE